MNTSMSKLQKMKNYSLEDGSKKHLMSQTSKSDFKLKNRNTASQFSDHLLNTSSHESKRSKGRYRETRDQASCDETRRNFAKIEQLKREINDVPPEFRISFQPKKISNRAKLPSIKQLLSSSEGPTR